MLNTVNMGKIGIQIENCNKLFVYDCILLKCMSAYNIIQIETIKILVCSLIFIL